MAIVWWLVSGWADLRGVDSGFRQDRWELMRARARIGELCVASESAEEL